MEITINKIISLMLSVFLFFLEIFSAFLGGGENQNPTDPPDDTTNPPATDVIDPSVTASGSFVFTTYGYGHGVGMSQCGAQAMALNGADYEEILKHYYTGIELSQITSLQE